MKLSLAHHHCLLLATLFFFVGVTAKGLAHEVTVYSYLTADGQGCPTPTAESPVRCTLASGGYKEFGNVPAGEQGPTLERVAPLIHAALTARHYAPQRDDASAPAAIVVVFQWGCLAPDFTPPGKEQLIIWPNTSRALALVGGRALHNADLPSDRAAIFNAATEDRYFVVVSAYDAVTFAAKKSRRLLWRTQMSVPCAGLTQDAALPLLVTAGTALLGSDTPLPQRIELITTK